MTLSYSFVAHVALGVWLGMALHDVSLGLLARIERRLRHRRDVAAMKHNLDAFARRFRENTQNERRRSTPGESSLLSGHRDGARRPDEGQTT